MDTAGVTSWSLVRLSLELIFGVFLWWRHVLFCLDLYIFIYLSVPWTVTVKVLRETCLTFKFILTAIENFLNKATLVTGPDLAD